MFAGVAPEMNLKMYVAMKYASEQIYSDLETLTVALISFVFLEFQNIKGIKAP